MASSTTYAYLAIVVLGGTVLSAPTQAVNTIQPLASIYSNITFFTEYRCDNASNEGALPFNIDTELDKTTKSVDIQVPVEAWEEWIGVHNPNKCGGRFLGTLEPGCIDVGKGYFDAPVRCLRPLAKKPTGPTKDKNATAAGAAAPSVAGAVAPTGASAEALSKETEVSTVPNKGKGEGSKVLQGLVEW